MAERIKLDPPYSAGGSNVGGENILPPLGPIPLGRSTLVRRFTPDICLFARDLFYGATCQKGAPIERCSPLAGSPLSRLALRLSLAVENQRRARMKLRTAK